MNVKAVLLAFSLVIAVSTAYGAELVSEVIKLQRAGIEREIILNFVQDSPLPSNLSANDIQRLDDEGVSATVIVAMLDRGKELRERQQVEVAAEPEYRNHAGTDSDDSNYEVYAPRENEADISLFYETLAPHGTWSRDSNYGWVWQPTVQVRDRDWRPYGNDGHWVWTDHGWYWESTSSYGWAVYHYGRWHQNRERNWQWVPDNVWGPSWVDWRQSDTHLGWAPLPPDSRFEGHRGFRHQNRDVGFNFRFELGDADFSFVLADRFLEPNVRSHFVPRDRVQNVYNNTKVVNNTYIYNDNRIINQGVSREVVSRHTKRQVEVVKIEDAGYTSGQVIRGERRDANRIVAYRPKVINAAPVEPPVIVARQKEVAAARQVKRQEEARNAKTERADDKREKTQAAADKREVASDKREVAADKREVASDKREADVKNRQEAEQAARRRVQEVRAQKLEQERTEKKSAEVKKEANDRELKTPAMTTPAEDRRTANEAAATARKTAQETENKAREDASNTRKAAEAAEREARAKANQDATKERKDARDAAQDAREKGREINTPAATAPAEDRRTANEAAATARKAAQEAESKARDDAANTRKAAEAAEREAKAKESQAATKERKDARDATQDAKEKTRDENTAATAKAAEERRTANEAAAVLKKAATDAEGKVRADAAKERKEDAAEDKAAKDKERDEKREERKDKRD